MTLAVAAQRRRLSGFARVYAGIAVLMVVTVAYLALTAQATKSAYQLSLLQQENQQLRSTEGQLQYQDAALHTPARVAQEAQQAGLVQTTPYRYITFAGSEPDLNAAIGPAATRLTPLWEQLAAALFALTGHDALAADLTR
ncbi:MAG TPA: hypothetical protein VNI34_03855 [Candidatus Nitrosotalea sp.]|nr:hypothetical protein [Candidatus Nitrosotalea sp.]